MSSLQLYAIFVLPEALKIMFFAVSVIGLISSIFCGAVLLLNLDDYYPRTSKSDSDEVLYIKKLKKYLIISIVCFIGCSFSFGLTPSSKQMATLYVVPKITNNEVLQNDVEELYNLSVEYMRKVLTVDSDKPKED